MDKDGLATADKDKVRGALTGINGVLNVMDMEAPEPDKEVAGLIAQRDEARGAKDWATADRIREQLAKMGIEITDTRDGAIWQKIKV